MPEAQIEEQLQATQDMLDVVAQQRDSANNNVVQLAAQLKAAQRKIKALEDEIARHAEAAPELDLGPQRLNGLQQPAAMN